MQLDAFPNILQAMRQAQELRLHIQQARRQRVNSSKDILQNETAHYFGSASVCTAIFRTHELGLLTSRRKCVRRSCVAYTSCLLEFGKVWSGALCAQPHQLGNCSTVFIWHETSSACNGVPLEEDQYPHNRSELINLRNYSIAIAC